MDFDIICMCVANERFFMKKKQSTDTVEVDTKSQVKTESVSLDFDLVKVMDGNRVVREYDVKTHGNSFYELAHSFAHQRGYTLLEDKLKGAIECPNCGHSFDA